jgi:hypothetical protein
MEPMCSLICVVILLRGVHPAEDPESRPTRGCRGCEPYENVTHTHHVENTRTYRHAVHARELIQAGEARRVCPTLVVRTTLLVEAVEDVGVAVVNVSAEKDIGDECQDGGLSDSSLSK